MKIEKVNGLYRKKHLSGDSRVPVLVWVPLVLILSGFVMWGALRVWILQQGDMPSSVISRKHSYKVVAVGDIACEPENINYNSGSGVANACQQKAVASAVADEHADAVLLLGDIQYDRGVFEDFEKSFVPPWRNVTVPIYSIAGNHDYKSGNLNGYKKAFDLYMPNVTYQKEGKTYYAFNLGQWQFYALDSNCEFVGGCDKKSPQYQWLTSQVKAHTNQCSVALWHHPVYTSGQHNELPDITYGQDFWNILASAGSDIVLNGHDHDYERFAPMDAKGALSDSGVREFVVGTGGYNLRPYSTNKANSTKKDNEHLGYLVLELSPGHYTWQFKGVNSHIYDSGSANCH